YLIIGGRVVAHGTPEELKRNRVAIDGYLGDTFEDEGITRANPNGHAPIRPRPYEPPAAMKPRAFRADLPDPDQIVPLATAEAPYELSVATAERPSGKPQTPPPRGVFIGSTQQLLEHERM